MFDYDTPAARTKFRSFKSRLTRLVNKKDHRGVIALWKEFKTFYDSRNWPMPDSWRRWESAAEDAIMALLRAGDSDGGPTASW